MAGAPPEPFELASETPAIRGEGLGEGPPVVLAHGLTATRRYVVHGSKALARAGYRQLSYDARGHGGSGAAGEGEGYGYPELAADLGRVIDSQAASLPVLCGDSMGAHTIAVLALERAERLAGVVLIRPASLGLPPDEHALAHWDGLAAVAQAGGVRGFMAAYERDLEVSGEMRGTILRFTEERMRLHRDLGAVARALSEVPRSVPFEGMAELESLGVPALVVASRDEADPGHPYAVAEAWSEALPSACLISEPPGQAPLAWQGGRLAREIAAFCGSEAVLARRDAP